MNNLKVDLKGVNNFLKKRKFENSCDYLCEILGSLPGRVTKIAIVKIKNHLIVEGDDGGLSKDDIKRLKELFNSSGNGHSEYGIGVRTAGYELTITTNLVDFFVTDGFNGIKYKVLPNDDDQLLGYDELCQITAYNLYNLYETDISSLSEKETRRTKWIIPISENFNLTKCKYDIMKRFCKPLIEKKSTYTSRIIN